MMNSVANVVSLKRDIVRVLSRLACAIVAQAARDLHCETEIREGMQKWHRARRRQNAVERQSALQWLHDDATSHPFSLARCCEYINDYMEQEDLGYPRLIPETLREVLLERPWSLSSLVPETPSYEGGGETTGGAHILDEYNLSLDCWRSQMGDAPSLQSGDLLCLLLVK